MWSVRAWALSKRPARPEAIVRLGWGSDRPRATAERGGQLTERCRVLRRSLALLAGRNSRQCRGANEPDGFRLFYVLGEPKPELSHRSPVVLGCPGVSCPRKHQGVGC